MTALETELERYNRLNNLVETNSAVFFGADCFAGLPFAELRQDYGISMPVYNRSIPGISLNDADKYLDECVYALQPSRIFINLGEADLTHPGFDSKTFLAAYEWLLYTLHSRCNARIYIVSVVSANPLAYGINDALRALARSSNCDFIDITAAAAAPKREAQIFDCFRYYLHDHPLDFADAFLLHRHG